MSVKDIDIIKTLLLKEEETETLPQGFEEDPMGFILKKYPGLNNVMEYMMTEDFKEYVDAIFIVAPKPTTFKVLLHNGQFFFLQFMGKAYQATVQGKNYYLMSIGEKERCMLAIARLLRYGNPIKTKGPEGAEQGTRPEGETGTEGGETGETAGETPEAGGEAAAEETPVTEATILEEILKKSLVEARGIIGRKSGDKFSDGKTTLDFEKVEVYPTEKEKYDSKEHRDEQIKSLESEFGTSIQFVNSASNNLSFAVAELKGENGEKVYWGKYFKQKSPNMMGKWSNDEVPSGFKLQTKSAKKSVAGFSPQDLIKTESKFSSIDAIIATVKKNSEGNPAQETLVNALEELKSGNLPTFKDQAENLEALRDYFGEIMAPIALMANVVKGKAEEAKDTLLGEDANWSDCEVYWPQSKTAGLSDSKMLYKNQVEVGISSKGGSGARASSKNIMDAIEKSPEDLVKKYDKAVQILKTISDKSAIDGVFELAKQLEILPQELESEIRGYIKSGKSDTEGLSKAAQKMMSTSAIKPDTQGFKTGLALLSILAKAVAKKINSESEEVKFSEAAKAFLNNSSVVQVYCYMKKSGADATVTGFEAIYPPNFEGKVFLDASKNYTSTLIKGKMSFGFK